MAIVTTDANGVWQAPWSLAAAKDGKYTLTARSVDLAGNVSVESTGLVVTLDTTAPVAPSVLEISDDRGTSATDQLTNDPTLRVAGTAEAGTLVTLFRDGTQVGTATADAAGVGPLDTTSTPPADVKIPFTATATAVSGNPSAASTPPQGTIYTATIDPAT